LQQLSLTSIATSKNASNSYSKEVFSPFLQQGIGMIYVTVCSIS